MPWLYLAVAIGSEVVGTLTLRRLSEGFVWWAAILMVVAYLISFGILIPALKHINVGVAYAIWSAAGTAVVAILGAALFREKLNLIAVGGIALIVGGVVMVTASGSTTHG